MIMVVGAEITPIKHYGAFSGMIGITMAIGSILGKTDWRHLIFRLTCAGPILGGVITTESTWRWIYLFNAPCAAIGVLGLLLFWPRPKGSGTAAKVSLQSLRNVDFLGAILLLAASTLLVFALQEAGGAAYAWNSAVIISTLVLSSFCWVAFLGWISWLSLSARTFPMRAIFPVNIALTRPTGPAILYVTQKRPRV